MQKIIFIELPVARKEQYVTDITESLFALNKSIHIFAQKNNLVALDRLLWVRKPDSFLPHAIFQESDQENPDLLEPILLIDRPVRLTADVLILHDPLPVDQIGSYELIIDFAELYDQNRLKDSRQRYKVFRDSGRFDLSFEKLGSFLKLIKAS